MTTWTTWLAMAVLLAVVVALGLVGFWLWRRRRRVEARAELCEELGRSLQPLGLGPVWQTPLYRADIFGFGGEVNGFLIRGEVWENSPKDFFRLDVRFPRPLRQGMLMHNQRRKWFDTLGRRRAVALDEVFDRRFKVIVREGDAERVAEILDSGLRGRILDLEKRVAEFEVGEHSLHLYVDKELEVPRIERLVRDALRLAVELYNRAIEIGPVKTVMSTEYEMVSIDSLGRETETGIQGTSFPEGSVDVETEPSLEGVVSSRSSSSGAESGPDSSNSSEERS